MSTLEAAIRTEIEDLHVFFVDWFTGTAPKAQLQTRFGAAMDEKVIFISPDGEQLGKDDLMVGIAKAYGANKNFRIAVRDVRIQREFDDLVLATYTEWQRGGARSERGESGRLTTVLLTQGAPHRWLHVHETWLPEAQQLAGPYDF